MIFLEKRQFGSESPIHKTLARTERFGFDKFLIDFPSQPTVAKSFHLKDPTRASLSLSLYELARFFGEHPSAVFDIEVAPISDEYYLRRWRDPFEDFGLVV